MGRWCFINPRVVAGRRQSRIRAEPVMNKDSSYVGLDVHKATIQVALFTSKGGRPIEWSL